MKVQKRHMVDIIFALGLFFVFALSMLSVVTMGAGVYERTINSMDKNFTTRTTLKYVTEKIHQATDDSVIYIDILEDTPSLIIENQIGEQSYRTYIYHYNGTLMEAFASSTAQFSPENGQVISTVKAFGAKSVLPNLYEFYCTLSDGEIITALVHSDNYLQIAY